MIPLAVSRRSLRVEQVYSVILIEIFILKVGRKPFIKALCLKKSLSRNKLHIYGFHIFEEFETNEFIESIFVICTRELTYLNKVEALKSNATFHSKFITTRTNSQANS